MPRIQINNDAEWHAIRAQHVGASEVGAVFDLEDIDTHKFMTHFKLWHLKKGDYPAEDLSDNDRVFWGTVLEPAVAEGVRQKMGWTVRKIHTYWTSDRVKGMGASLDYEIVGHEKGPGVLQIKCCDGFAYRHWKDDDTGIIEPPMQYELQVQHEMAVSNRQWGVLAVLVGGNQLVLFERERHQPTIDRIEKAIADFWRSIKDNIEPMPDYDRDLEAIRALYAESESGKEIDLSTDNAAHSLCAEYKECTAAAKAANERKDAVKAELLYKIGTHEKAFIGPFTISSKMIREKHIEYDRKSYRDFRITEKKAKQKVAA